MGIDLQHDHEVFIYLFIFSNDFIVVNIIVDQEPVQETMDVRHEFHTTERMPVNYKAPCICILICST